MNRYWTERTVDFKGEFDRVHHAGISPGPIQRPIPVWFGGSVDAVLKRAAKYGQGWIPLGNPSSNTKAQIARLHGFLAEEGRDPATFGLEAWIRSSLGEPEAWRASADAWRDLGATHTTFYTSGLGVGSVDKQIEAMRRFMAAMQ
jgi:alkanesulfonate monooxygenase SsuD/methylene tetrahydromethanopterin reductase-like flavin-dependent oxidoreductase (luciferase family)